MVFTPTTPTCLMFAAAFTADCCNSQQNLAYHHNCSLWTRRKKLPAQAI